MGNVEDYNFKASQLRLKGCVENTMSSLESQILCTLKTNTPIFFLFNI